MKRLAILLLSLILIVSTAACSREQSQVKKAVPVENPQVNQTQNVNQPQNTNQKTPEVVVKDKKATSEQTEKVNTEINNLSNEIEKTLDSLDDIDESKLSF